MRGLEEIDGDAEQGSSIREGGQRGSDCAPGHRHGATGSQLRQVWKNNGSAVKMEPHGETSAMGAQKTRDINRLARAALEREEQVREYRVRSGDMGQFQGIRARQLPWRRERRCGSEDSLGNPAIPWGIFPVLHGVTPILQSYYSTYNRLTAARAIASGRAGGEANAAGEPGCAARDRRRRRHSGRCPCGAR